ncbi:unnamed protein product [Sphagnum jensenii]
MLGVLNQLLRKSSCFKNLYLFTELFLCGLVGGDGKNNNEINKFVSKCLKEKFRRESLQKVETLEDLYDLLVGFWDDQLSNKGRIKNLLLALSISQKGLTAE